MRWLSARARAKCCWWSGGSADSVPGSRISPASMGHALDRFADAESVLPRARVVVSAKIGPDQLRLFHDMALHRREHLVHRGMAQVAEGTIEREELEEVAM